MHRCHEREWVYTRHLAFLAIAGSSVLSAQQTRAEATRTIPVITFNAPLVGKGALGLTVERSALRVRCGYCEEVTMTGKASFGNSPFGIYGKLSTLQQRTPLPGLDAAQGTALGGGISWDLSPRTSASIGWESYDLRLGGTVRSTNLGLQWRY